MTPPQSASMLFSEAHRRSSALPPSWVIAFLSSGLVTLLFTASSDSFQHWFILPVCVCGAVASIDAVEWIRGRVQPFDPAGLVGVYGTFALFFVPLLHVRWEFWMYEVPPPPDWRDWLGYMALLNVAGMFAYRISKAAFAKHASSRNSDWVWRPTRKRFLAVATAGLCATAARQV